MSGIFGGPDTAASIFLAIGELLEKDMDKPCEAGGRALGVKIALMRFLNWLMGALVRLIANQIDEAQVFTGSGPSQNPTHTQLAKDHDDHVLHVLAAQCAQSAVKDIGARMAEAWDKTAVERAALTASLLDRAESYFVHPDLVVTSPGPPDNQVTIMNIARRFAADPANAAAIVRAGKRTGWTSTSMRPRNSARGSPKPSLSNASRRSSVHELAASTRENAGSTWRARAFAVGFRLSGCRLQGQVRPQPHQPL